MPINYFCAGVGFTASIFCFMFGYPLSGSVMIAMGILNLALAGSYHKEPKP